MRIGKISRFTGLHELLRRHVSVHRPGHSIMFGAPIDRSRLALAVLLGIGCWRNAAQGSELKPVGGQPLQRFVAPVRSTVGEMFPTTSIRSRESLHPLPAERLSGMREPMRLARRPDTVPRVIPARISATSQQRHRIPAFLVVSETWSDGSRATVVLIVGAVAFGCALVLRRQLVAPLKRGASHREYPQAGSAGSLDALILNALPVVEEPVLLPQGGEVFGRPRLECPYRADSPHALHGPHYPVVSARSAAESPSVPADDELRAPLAKAATPVRRFRVDKAHPRSGAGALDRALATFEGRNS